VAVSRIVESVDVFEDRHLSLPPFSTSGGKTFDLSFSEWATVFGVSVASGFEVPG